MALVIKKDENTGALVLASAAPPTRKTLLTERSVCGDVAECIGYVTVPNLRPNQAVLKQLTLALKEEYPDKPEFNYTTWQKQTIDTAAAEGLEPDWVSVLLDKELEVPGFVKILRNVLEMNAKINDKKQEALQNSYGAGNIKNLSGMSMAAHQSAFFNDFVIPTPLKKQGATNAKSGGIVLDAPDNNLKVDPRDL